MHSTHTVYIIPGHNGDFLAAALTDGFAGLSSCGTPSSDGPSLDRLAFTGVFSALQFENHVQ